MIYRTIPGTDLKISALAFGAWAIGGWLWGGTDRKEAIRAIHAAIDQGMTTIDTAAIYGFGLSEELVGEAIRGKRNQVQILTKFSLRWDTSEGTLHYAKTHLADGTEVAIYRNARKETVIRECEESLRRLGIETIDLYQQHWPDPGTPIDETMEALDRLQQQGKIKYAGVSNFSVEQFEAANRNIPVPTNQVPFSMVNREIEKDLVPWCLENNRRIIAYSPLQRGLLTGKIKPQHQFQGDDHRKDNPYFRPQVIKKVNRFLDSLRPLAEGYNLSMAQLVLNWTLNQPAIVCALAGARNAEQVSDNVLATEARLSESDLQKINSELNSLNLKLTE